MNARRNPTNVFWSSYLTGIQILLLLVLVFCVIAGVEVRLDQGKPVISFNTEMNPDLESKGPLKDQQWKTYALKLKEAGLIDEASRALQNYFSGHKEAWNTESSVITYNLALAWQDRKEYAKALPLLFQAEITAKDSELIKEIKKQQMICFEKMGQPLNASRILDQALSSLESSPPSEDVLATIGDSRITLIEYQEALKKLPTPLGEQVLQSTDQKKNFLRQLVLNKLLYRKALKYGMEDDTLILKEVDRFKESLMANTLLESELGPLPKPTDLDLKNHFEAHLDQFSEGEGTSFEDVRDKVTADYTTLKNQERLAKLFSQLAQEDKVSLHEDVLQKF